MGACGVEEGREMGRDELVAEEAEEEEEEEEEFNCADTVAVVVREGTANMES